MRPDSILICALAGVVSALLTGVVRSLALRHGLLDIPNARSSHSTVTPRGGGLAIVIACTAALVALGFLGYVRLDLLVSLIGGGAAVAVIGFLDDRRPIPASVRLAVHLSAALWSLIWLGGLPPLQIGADIVRLGLTGDVIALLGIVWVLNLFNFMDGIDGIAASETVFVVCGVALLALIGGFAGQSVAAGCALGAVCAGFLLWNWPPAKIFMGDVGSGYLGYVVGVLTLAATRDDPAAVWVWLILGGVFFIDATLTLVRRIARGERAHEAHRSHGYQHLARRWGSHKRTTIFILIVDLLWLLPCALVATMYPDRAAWIALGALLPIAGLALAAGAGRPEYPIESNPGRRG